MLHNLLTWMHLLCFRLQDGDVSRRLWRVQPHSVFDRVEPKVVDVFSPKLDSVIDKLTRMLNQNMFIQS